MENNTDSINTNGKIVTVCFMGLAILVGLVVSVMMETLSAIGTGAFGRFVSDVNVRTIVPVVAGIAVFAFLQTNRKIVSWSDDVITEIRRIVWPSRKETFASTFVVCIMLLIAGAALGLMDVLSGTFIDWLLHRNIVGIFT